MPALLAAIPAFLASTEGIAALVTGGATILGGSLGAGAILGAPFINHILDSLFG